MMKKIRRAFLREKTVPVKAWVDESHLETMQLTENSM